MNWPLLLAVVYEAGAIATFVFLTVFDGYVYNSWNWLVVAPINAALGQIWPIYWVILRPMMG